MRGLLKGESGYREAQATEKVRASRREDGMPLLALEKGQHLSVVAQENEGWVIAQVGGFFGLVPAGIVSFVQPASGAGSAGSGNAGEAAAGLPTLMKDLRVASLVVAFRFDQIVTTLIDHLMSGYALQDSLKQKVSLSLCLCCSALFEVDLKCFSCLRSIFVLSRDWID